MTDGEAPAPKKLKTADEPPATAAVVADNDAVDLVPPSLPLIQSIEHVDAVLALPREELPGRLHSNGGPPSEP